MEVKYGSERQEDRMTTLKSLFPSGANMHPGRSQDGSRKFSSVCTQDKVRTHSTRATFGGDPGHVTTFTYKYKHNLSRESMLGTLTDLK